MGGGRVGGVFWQESTWQERPFLFFKMLDSGEKGAQRQQRLESIWGLSIYCVGVWDSMEQSWHHFPPVPGQEVRSGADRFNPHGRLPDATETPDFSQRREAAEGRLHRLEEGFTTNLRQPNSHSYQSSVH